MHSLKNVHTTPYIACMSHKQYRDTEILVQRYKRSIRTRGDSEHERHNFLELLYIVSDV